MGRLIFVTGGARSGKSGFAQQQAESHDGALLYVATAAIGDDEMAERVKKHRQVRGERWRTLEAGVDLVERLPAAADGCAALLFDCLTLWLAARIEQIDDDAALAAEADELLAALKTLPLPVYLVANELGSGIVPENALARRFRDLHGLLNQHCAAAADQAYLVVAGLPLKLKP